MFGARGLFAGIGGIASPAITVSPTGSFRVSVSIKNPGALSTTYTLIVTMVGAPGEFVRQVQSFTLAPGQTSPFNLDFSPGAAGLSAWPVGVYDVIADLRLSPAFTLIDTKKLSAEVTVAAPPSAACPAEFAGTMAYYSGTQVWVNFSSVSSFPKNQDIYLAIGWINKKDAGIAAVTGHMDLITQDGASIAAYSNNDRTASPGNGFLVGFGPFRLATAGQHVLTARLTANGIDCGSLQLVLKAL